MSFVLCVNERLCHFFYKKKLLCCQINFRTFATIIGLTIFRLGAKQNKKQQLMNPCQSLTEIEESRLWGS